MEGLGNIAQIAGIGTAGAGLVGNILNSITRGRAIGKLEGYEKLTPQQLAEKVRGATAPLDQGLVEAIQNQVQADVGSRGLAQAPGIFAAEESQALAPAEQANIDRAIQLIFQQMGIPAEILASTTGGSDPMAALMMAFLANQKKTPAATDTGDNQVPFTPEGGDISQILQQIIAGQVPQVPDTTPTVPAGAY